MDERMLSILKAVAKECLDDDGWYCNFCQSKGLPLNREHYVDVVEHEASCPTILARAILKEQGQPMQVYEVSYELPKHETRKRWLTTGYSADEVRNSINAEKATDLQVSYVRDLG